jgi:L-alanine-DL-glutamate epimerase-like enolase superfamily enzyme
LRIVDIETFLMQVDAPNLRGWASDGSFGNRPSSKGLTGTRNWLFVKVHTDEGITGIGECSGWPRVIQTAVQDLKSILIGEDPTHIERLWQKMMSAIMGHGMTGTVGGGAMTGIDMALWDIKGKALNTPVWNLLGGKMRDKIRIYAHANAPDVAIGLNTTFGKLRATWKQPLGEWENELTLIGGPEGQAFGFNGVPDAAYERSLRFGLREELSHPGGSGEVGVRHAMCEP